MNPTRRSNPERILLEPIQDRHNQNQDRHNQNQDRHNQDRHNQDRHIRSQLFGTTLPGDGLPRLRTLGGQWSRVVVLAMAGMGFNAAPMQAREIGFVEDFALAADREKALSSLIPGTADYYYYHCLQIGRAHV